MRATSLQDAFTSIWPPLTSTPTVASSQTTAAAAQPVPYHHAAATSPSLAPPRTVRVMDADTARQLIREEVANANIAAAALNAPAPTFKQHELSVPPVPSVPSVPPPRPVVHTLTTPSNATFSWSWTSVGVIIGILLLLTAVILLAVLVANSASLKTTALLFAYQQQHLSRPRRSRTRRHKFT